MSAIHSSQFEYPAIRRRLRAVIFDMLIQIAVLALAVWPLALSTFPGSAKFGLLACIVIALEPGMVSFTGATPGQHILGLRVVNGRTKRNLGLLTASFRFILKALLGWVSLILIIRTKRYQALHDMAVNSVVIVSDQARRSGVETYGEKTEQDR